MKIFFLLIVVCFQQNLQAQDKGTPYYFKEINWRVTLPESFVIIDALATEKLKEKGVALMEKANDLEVGALDDLKDLISAKKDDFNYINATIRPYDAEEEGEFPLSTQMVKDAVYNSLLTFPNVKLDSISSTIKLDNLTFEKFTVQVSINNQKYLTMVVLSKFYKGYDFGITYTYLDEKSKMEIENMLATSSFSK